MSMVPAELAAHSFGQLIVALSAIEQKDFP